MRLVLATMLAMTVAGAGACGKSGGSVAGGSGGAADGEVGGSASTAVGSGGAGAIEGGGLGGATVVADSGGAGGTGHAGGAGGGAVASGAGGSPYQLQACVGTATSTDTRCACDSTAPACQAALAANCVGQLCPPTFAQARLAATWPLTAYDQTPAGWVHGDYLECDDGTRTFWLQENGVLNGLSYDAGGNLLASYILVSQATPTGGVSSCSHQLCTGSGSCSSCQPTCSDCQMTLTPAPEGTHLIPRGFSNGPSAACEVDGSGRWSMPHLAPN